MPRVLKPEWQDLADEFQSYEDIHGGCSCFINPPCSWCTHEGNPLNLEEAEEAWEDE